MKTTLIATALAVAVWLAQDKPSGGLEAVQQGDLQWKDADGLPAGVKVAHAFGDPKGGPAVDYLKFPAGARVPLHRHSANHVVTVLSGRVVIGTPAIEKGLEVGPGGCFKLAGRVPHWTWAREESVIQVTGDAPNDLHWAAKP